MLLLTEQIQSFQKRQITKFQGEYFPSQPQFFPFLPHNCSNVCVSVCLCVSVLVCVWSKNPAWLRWSSGRERESEQEKRESEQEKQEGAMKTDLSTLSVLLI